MKGFGICIPFMVQKGSSKYEFDFCFAFKQLFGVDFRDSLVQILHCSPSNGNPRESNSHHFLDSQVHFTGIE